MTRVPAVVSLGVALLLCGVRSAAGDQTPDAGIVAAIHVQGNTLTPTEDIVAASGVTVGDVFAPDLPARVETRLRATGRFEGVDVRARFASIADPSRIALVIVVDERPVRVLPAPADRDEQPRVLRRGWLRSMMLMPLVSGEDGYGVTYGGAVAWPGVLGRRSRLTIPLTWGGTGGQASKSSDGLPGRSGFASPPAGRSSSAAIPSTGKTMPVGGSGGEPNGPLDDCGRARRSAGSASGSRVTTIGCDRSGWTRRSIPGSMRAGRGTPWS